MYIAEEAVTVLLGAIVFTTDPTMITSKKYVFMILIILSRCGLYGFEVGEMQFMQQGLLFHPFN